MMRLNTILTLLIATILTFSAQAQKRAVEEVKKSIDGLSSSINTFKNARTKIKAATTNDETKNLAETWWVAARVEFGLYEKYRQSKAVGNTVSDKEMGETLINGYELVSKALQLDTVREKLKDGRFKIDPKTQHAKVKTKYSKDIWKQLLAYMVDYSAAGGNLYNSEDWDDAYKAWDIYHTIATSAYAKEKHHVDPDTTIGLMRFYQGLAAYQKKDYKDAHRLFVDARNWKYVNKLVFDNDLNALVKLGDTTQVVQVAHDAYQLYGAQDIQYLRILINDYLGKRQYQPATDLLDQAIAHDPANAEYYDLKGNIAEQQQGTDSALVYYQKAIEINPEFALGQFDVGRCYYIAALEFIKKNSNLRGRKLQEQVRPLYERALPGMEKAYQLDSKNDDAYNILKDLYYRLGEGEKLDALEQARKQQ